MAGLGKYASAALLIVVMIMMGAAEAAEVKAASPSPTMQTGAASMAVFPSLFTALIASFIPFLASLLLN
uniref:Uncharacterized protein n=1 Tax=Picea sitchensis TaxID=3332 RepID=A9NKU4_PICSI|nr:unknown [Picea sitchensis]ABK26345.1 unknown [Picea sitchensis]